MKKDFFAIISFILAILILIAIAYILITLIASLSGSSDNYKTAVLGAIVSISAVIIAKHYEKTREIEQEHRKIKVETYKRFIGMFFRMLEEDKVSKKEMHKEVIHLRRELFLWGNEKVIDAMISFSSGKENASFTGIRLMTAMREDLGNKRIDEKKLIKLLIKNEEHDKIDDLFSSKEQ